MGPFIILPSFSSNIGMVAPLSPCICCGLAIRHLAAASDPPFPFARLFPGIARRGILVVAITEDVDGHGPSRNPWLGTDMA